MVVGWLFLELTLQRWLLFSYLHVKVEFFDTWPVVLVGLLCFDSQSMSWNHTDVISLYLEHHCNPLYILDILILQ